MTNCSFCGTEIEQGTGKMLVKKDGSLLHFCSRKCEKNLIKLKRNPLKTPWTRAYRKFKGKLKPDEDVVVVEEKVKKGAMPKFVDGGDKKGEAPAEEKKAEESKPAENGEKVDSKKEAKPADKPKEEKKA